MFRSPPRPFYIPAEPPRYGERMMRIRAWRMGFVVCMLGAIAAAPFVLFIGASAF